MKATFCIGVILGSLLVCSSIAKVVRRDPDYEDDDDFEDEVDAYPITSISSKAGCNVPIRGGMNVPTPLIIKPGSSEIVPYNEQGEMVVDAGKSVELVCPGGFAPPLSGENAIATCVSGTSFKVNGKNHDFSVFNCTAWAGFSGRKTGKSCNGGTTMVDVGFQIDAKRFLKEYEVCFNEDLEVTRYVFHSLTPASNRFANNVDRITFSAGGFFNKKNVDKLYTQGLQQATIAKALGYEPKKYFEIGANIYLARGHMAAKADFVYGTGQRSTFMFINVAPQWQSFNAGNWKKVEDNLRSWVAKKKMYVDTYTGVYGVTTLPNKQGVETPLYLTYDNKNNGLIPVPKLYFKVVIQPSTRKGVVLLGVNNPHLTLAQIKKDYIICNDISDKLTWLTWKKTDIKAGYSYACEVSDFRKKVTHLPTFDVTGLLL